MACKVFFKISPVPLLSCCAGFGQDSQFGQEGALLQGDVMKRWRCMVCGYIHLGDEPPEQCPVCKAPKSKFAEIDAQGTTITPSTEKPAQQPQVENIQPGGISPSATKNKMADFVLRHHLHPILVHTPNGLIPVIVLFILLHIILHIQGVEKAAFFNIVFVVLIMPAVMITGYLEWKKRYNKAKTALFFTKICCSLIVFATVLVLAGWRFINPEVTSEGSPTKWIYFSICLIMLGAAGIAGHLGGKLVFGLREK
jgi:rubredoxin